MAETECPSCAGDRTALHDLDCEVFRAALPIYVSDSDDDESAGLLFMQGPGASRAAKHLQSTMGSRWESDDDHYAYCAITVDDWDTILADVEEETGHPVEDRIGQ